MNNRIRSIIQSFLTSKDDYTHLKPIGIVTGGYGTQWGVGFKPMDGYKKEGYDIKDDLTDDSKRINILEKLNKDIRAYNQWSDGRLEYPYLDEYSPWSFLVVRADLEYVDKKLYVEIIDEELYKSKDDDDFVPRFNKSIYDYIRSMIKVAKEEDRWTTDSDWFQPNINFGKWFEQKGISHKDIKSYFKGNDNENETSTIDPEHSVAINIIKKQKRQISAMKIHRHKPTQMEMKQVIDKNRFKNEKANNTKIGEELGVDPETAKSWIKKLGLSDYAYNPNHLK